MKKETDKIVLSGLFIAIGIVLPTFFANQELAARFSPMHIPVLLAGIILGWKYGFLIGVITPLLRSLLLTMPPMQIAIPMAFELATYGLIIGLFYNKIRLFKDSYFNIYFALIIALVAGRIVYGIYNGIYYGFSGQEYGFKIYFTSVFIKTIPAIVTQILLIPAIVRMLEVRNILLSTNNKF